jgi:hypothetical protein
MTFFFFGIQRTHTTLRIAAPPHVTGCAMSTRLLPPQATGQTFASSRITVHVAPAEPVAGAPITVCDYFLAELGLKDAHYGAEAVLATPRNDGPFSLEEIRALERLYDACRIKYGRMHIRVRDHALLQIDDMALMASAPCRVTPAGLVFDTTADAEDLFLQMRQQRALGNLVLYEDGQEEDTPPPLGSRKRPIEIAEDAPRSPAKRIRFVMSSVSS